MRIMSSPGRRQSRSYSFLSGHRSTALSMIESPEEVKLRLDRGER
jgi:hypothetical protein